MIQAYLDFTELWRTGSWSVFLTYFVFAFCIAWTRRAGGMRFYYLIGAGLLQNYPDRTFSVTAFVTATAKDDPDMFRENMRRLVESLRLGTKRFALLVTIDAKDYNEAKAEALARAAMEEGATVVWKTTAHRKRLNLVTMFIEARKRGILYELCMFVDGDSKLSHRNVVKILARPFCDPRIGGATTAQRIENPRLMPQIIADQLEHARLLASMAFTSLYEQVPCLPGRVYMARTAAIERRIEELPHRTIGFGKMRVLANAGDDREITEYILQAGYRTILVPRAQATTLAYDTFTDLFKAWVRWGRSSQVYTLRAWYWLPLRYPVAALVMWSDLFLMVGTVYIVGVHWPYHWVVGNGSVPLVQALLVALGGMCLTLGIGQAWHYRRHPWRIVLLPLFAVVMTFAQFLRLYALLTWFWIGKWGTRKEVDAKAAEVVYELYHEERPA